MIGAWPPQGVTFAVRRGTFTLPRGLRDDDPEEFGRAFARALEGKDGAAISSRVEGQREVFTWRIIRVVPA